MILTKPRERTRFIRFAIVGAFGALVDFIIYNLLMYLLSVPVVLAGTVSFLTAVASNLTWNRYWTYPDSRSKTLVRQWFEFLVINAMGLVIRVPILAFLDPLMRRLFAGLQQFTRLSLRSPFFTPNALGDNVTLAIAIIIVMFWNFFANRYWTYADVEA